MDLTEILKLILAIIAGIATAIPLIVKLVAYVKACAKEKNWSKMLNLVMILMGEAEGMFADGAEKKAWVLQRLQLLSSTLDYDVDIDAVSKMIDALCEMSKNVNAPSK